MKPFDIAVAVSVASIRGLGLMLTRDAVRPTGMMVVLLGVAMPLSRHLAALVEVA
jgi:hypothetical protein